MNARRFSQDIFRRMLALMSAGLVLTGCSDQPAGAQNGKASTGAASSPSEVKAYFERIALRENCAATLDKKRTEYERLMRGRMYWEASLQLRICSEALADVPLKTLVADAEIKSHLKVIEDPKAPAREKAESMERLLRDYPDKGRRYESLILPLKERAGKEDRAAAAAAKRKEGVRIGMTQEEVIASAWGKPRSINKTTFAHGVHEQWVYGGHNYLYFENGVLVSIQH